jgi:plasmid stabilization system protein ParE
VKFVLTADAIVDIKRLRAFLEGENTAAAKRAASLLSDAIEALSVFPERGRPSGIQGIRELIVPFGRSAYVVRYAYRREIETVVVVRVWHGRENRNS